MGTVEAKRLKLKHVGHEPCWLSFIIGFRAAFSCEGENLLRVGPGTRYSSRQGSKKLRPAAEALMDSKRSKRAEPTCGI